MVGSIIKFLLLILPLTIVGQNDKVELQKMTKKEKLLQKFQKNPSSLKFSEVEKILFHFGFEKIQGKGSHIKYKNYKFITTKIVISLHNNDCKNYQKEDILEKLKLLNLIS